SSEYESYQKMSMASSLYKPMLANDPEFAVSTRSYFHARSGFHYEMVVRDGKFYQKRFLLDASGKPRQVHEEEITYVVGSGNHARSYLRHHSDGRITQFPVTWYPQENSWAMSPGYDSAGQPDISRDVNHDCVFCHTSYPKLI